MRKRLLVAVASISAVLLGYYVQSHIRSRPTLTNPPEYMGGDVVQIPHPVTAGTEVVLKSTPTTIPKTGDPVAAALNALLAPQTGQSAPSAFPAGTRLLSVTVKAGVATVNLTKQFAELSNTGDSTEALAQKSLCRTLAQFHEVQSMLVRVDGQPFESEHTDWSNPIPVRDDSATQDAVQ